ncbi:hypothetical protein GGS21DRAFT_266069 [Xylaria nigripes]|nr:hypothetical protein GGS21DRAFT_266069 [Xylaria nigripes]
MSSKYSYHHLSAHLLADPDIISEEKPVNYLLHEKKARRASLLHWIVHVLSLVSVIGLFAIYGVLHDQAREMKKWWDTHNYYSPASEFMATQPYTTVQFNGSLWYDSPFKGPPTPEVEDAWQSIMQYGTISVTKSDYERVNHSVRTAVQFPEEAGGGYLATMVGTHQLHCLHFVWQDHHRDYFPKVQHNIKEVPEMYERHYEHCIDYIRQTIMCQFDTGLVTYDWVLQHQNPTPNSNAMHMCVNWDALQGWLQSRAVDIPDQFEWRQPEGQESLTYNP